MKTKKAITKKRMAVVTAVFILFTCICVAAVSKQASSPPSVSQTSRSSSSPAVDKPPPQEFNKQQYPVDEAASLWVVVNKGRSLPPSYVPSDLVVPSVPLRLSTSAPEMHLRSDAAKAMEEMVDTAADQNIKLMLASGYRSYSSQAALNKYYAQIQGQAEADKVSAHAGHSEHQTGLTADLEPASRQCEIEECFALTPEGLWLAANAHNYGFIIRYPADKVDKTGYSYEPWHVRYLGKELAGQLYSLAQAMEEFFSLPYYTSYPAQPLQLK